jgi:hypothetical protein
MPPDWSVARNNAQNFPIMQRIGAADPYAPAFIRCVAGYLLHPGFIRGKMFKIQLSLKERGLWEKL